MRYPINKTQDKWVNQPYYYKTGNAPQQEQICYAVSDDGFSYRPLNGGRPVVSSDSIALTGCVRDPHILRTDNGRFLMVARQLRDGETAEDIATLYQ